MADGQSLFSRSEAMIIGLELRSGSDLTNDGATNETDRDSRCSPAKQVVGSPSSRSEQPEELQTEGDGDVAESVCHGRERSDEGGDVSVFANCDWDGAQEENQVEDNPSGLQGLDEDSRVDDGHAEKRLGVEDEAGDNVLGETDGVSEENVRENGETAAQTVTSSIEPGKVGLQNVIGDDDDDQDAVLQREACSPGGGGGDLGEGSEDSNSGQDVKTCLERSDTVQMEGESDGEPASHSVTRSPECSIPFEMSETFLDNMNPQDDSQDMEEDRGMDVEEDEHKAAVKENVGGQESSVVSESQSRTPEHSLDFELSETFLDNLNPQDDSQDFGEVCEEEGAEGKPKASEIELKDSSGENVESVVLERTDASEDKVANSLQRDETMEMDGDNVLEAVSQRTAGSPERSLPFELSETFLDNLNPQDDSQDLEEEMEEKDGDRSVSDTNKEDIPSSLEREESAGEEALSHIPSDAAGNDEPASPAQHNANTNEISSPHQPQVPAEETPSLQEDQDATSCEAACLRTPPDCAVDEVSSPSTGMDTSAEDRATFPQDEPQSGDKGVKEKDCDQVMTDDEASSLHAQKHIAASDDAAVERVAAEESSSCEQNILPEKILSLSVGKDASPSEDEGGSPKTETHDGMSDEMTTIQDVKDDSSSSAVDAGKACVDHEEAMVDSPEEEPQALPSCEEGREEEESPANVEEDDDDDDDDAREEGEYSSSPSSSLEHGDIQDENASDVLQLSASDDVDIRDEGADKRKGKAKNLRAVRNARPQQKVCGESSRENHHRNSEDLNEAVVVDVNSDCEDDFRSFQDQLKKEKPEKEDENSVSNANVDSSVRDDSDAAGAFSQEPSSKESPAVGVTVVTENGDGENGEEEGERTLVANDDNSDDDVQIIEGPPQEPIDTLIVDDDDDDVVPRSNVTSKPSVSESSRASKKKRTVEQDGHDLRIVIRDERREKEDSDKRHRRHERDRREERRSHSHRRSELDRKSSDRSSRRRHHRSRSHSRERRRRRSRSRSHSRDRASRRRHPRERSREKSADRERPSHRKRRRDRSHEHRHRSRSRSHSPKRSREDSWDKENRDDRENSRSKRRRYQRDGDKRKESQEEERSSSKYQDSSLSSKHSRTSRPSNNFTKDSSDSPSAAEKSDDDDDDSEGSVKEVVQNARPSAQSNVPADKPKKQEEDSKKETEVIPVDIPIPEPQDIPIPKPEDIPIPETEHIPVPPPFSIPVPQPELLPGPPVFSVILPPHPIFENPPLPPPEEEPRENPPEPPPLPPRWPEVLPTKGEGLLPTPIRRKAALEEAAAVYDPAHPTDDDGERFRFPGVPNSAHPPPELLAGPPPRLPGQLMTDGTFVPGPGEGGLLGPPPQRVPMQPVRFGPPRPVMVNHVVMERPPFSNGPFPNPLPGPPLPPRFPMEMGGPGGVVPLQGQFGQGPPPPGPLPPPQGFPGQLNDRFEDGPPVGQFPVSVPSGVPEMASMAPPPGLPPPPDLHLLSHPPPVDRPISEKPGVDDGFDKTLLMAQSLLVMKERQPPEGEPASLPASAMFKVPPPLHLGLDLQARSPGRFHLTSAEAAVSVEQLEDSTEVMDMDMSPLEEECELRMSSPPEEEAGAGGGGDGEQDKGKKVKPLAAIDLRAISNAILQLTSAATDDVPASAVELTNKEKYMKKLHLQERVVDEVKQALRPFYIYKKINKEEYKTILRKAVPKVCHSKSGDINPQKIQQLVEGYVDKFNKQRQHTEQKVKPLAKPASPKEKGKANGERAKPAR